MNYLLHGATLALAWFLLVNLALSLIVAGLGSGGRRGLPPAWWFTIRILPAVSAMLFVVAVFLPSYWRYEPRQTAEGFDVTLSACAIAGVFLLGSGGVRGVSAWHRARCRTRAWLGRARPVTIPHATVPVFEIDADYPLMVLVGVLRPRLLVTRGLMQALSDDELAACVAHEIGHWRAGDNLKRLAMRASPDAFFGTPTARALERRWAAAAEHAADDRAGHRGPAARCALASALVKVARLMPERITTEPISALIAGGEIATRVRRLLDDRARPPSAVRRRVLLASVGVVIAISVAYGPLLHAVHHTTEMLVQFLP